MTNVYLLKNALGHYKIGVTRWKPKDRIASMQTGSSVAIELVAFKSFENSRARQVEIELHKKYQSLRLFGEWFALDSKHVGEIVSFLSVKKRQQDGERKKREVVITTEVFKNEYLRHLEAAAYIAFMVEGQDLDANQADNLLRYLVKDGLLKRANITGCVRNPVFLYKRTDIEDVLRNDCENLVREFVA